MLVVIPELINCFLPNDKVPFFAVEVLLTLPTNQTANSVVEAATENVDLKLNIFKQLDALTPEHVILASNTSSISITKIASVTNRPEKVIGMHFMNPVPVMKLVEIIRGYSTTDEVTNLIMETSKKLNKVPVEVNDYPGFVANRILMPKPVQKMPQMYNLILVKKNNVKN